MMQFNYKYDGATTVFYNITYGCAIKFRGNSRHYNNIENVALTKSKFSDEELSFIDSLFISLDKANLLIIEAVINSKKGR